MVQEFGKDQWPQIEDLDKILQPKTCFEHFIYAERWMHGFILKSSEQPHQLEERRGNQGSKVFYPHPPSHRGHAWQRECNPLTYASAFFQLGLAPFQKAPEEVAFELNPEEQVGLCHTATCEVAEMTRKPSQVRGSGTLPRVTCCTHGEARCFCDGDPHAPGWFPWQPEPPWCPGSSLPVSFLFIIGPAAACCLPD